VPVSDQVRPIESSKPAAASGFHAELHSIWGPPPALTQAGQFLAGVGEGFGQAVNEGVKATVQAVSNPGEALHKAATDAGKAVVGVLTATEKAGEYIGDHAERGDWKGMAHDADKTSYAIEYVLTAGIEHLSKMNAHDLGKVVGHDVLPGAIVAVAAPELAGESIALAASAASKIGTVVKEGAVIEKVAGAYEAATSKIASISEKMEGLNRKMADFHDEIKESITVGKRVRDSKIVRGERISEGFYHEVRDAELALPKLEAKYVSQANIVPVHNMAEASLPRLIEEHGMTKTAVLEARRNALVEGDWRQRGSTIRIAEFTGLKGDLVPNTSVRHSLIHEASHMIDDMLGPGGAPLSFEKKFRDLVNLGLADNPAARQAWDAMRDYNGHRKLQEVWAYQATNVISDELGLPPQETGLPKLIRDGFPQIYDHIKDFRGKE
jgi:hypothetical protein